MNLSFQTSLLLVLVASAFAIAFSAYIYKHTVPVVSRAQRITLIILRSFAFLLTLAALFEPLLTLSSSHNELPAVAVLVDNSLSMSHADKTGKRDSILRSLLSGNAFASLEAQSSIQLIKFSYAASVLSRDSLQIAGGSTNISSALQYAVKESPAALQSIILITDGNYNTGSNPLYEAERSRIPMYTVGIGDTVEQSDLSISKLLTNSIGYVDASLPIDAVIKSSGISTPTLAVSLLEDGKVVDEKIISISSQASGVGETPVQFLYTPKNDGIKKLSVRIPVLTDEGNGKNNSRSALVKILKSKMNIVVIAGSPSPDVSTVMQSLKIDKNISSALFLQLPNGELKSEPAAPTLNQSLSSADCIIFIGFPTSQSSSQIIRTVESTIRSRQVAALFIAGRIIDLQKIKELESLFPFTVISNRIDEQTVLPYVMPQYKYHALVQIDGSQFPSFTWEKLPPIYSSFQSYAPKPEAQILLGTKIQGVTLQNPLLIVRNVANTKSLAILGYGMYRWKLLASTSEETRNVFDVWFSSLVRWLSTRDQDSQLKVEPVKELFSQGEPIEFTGQVYNENFQPIDNADLHISIRTLGKELAATVSMESIGSGRYDGTAASLNEGEYSYRAVSLMNGDTLGTAIGRFSVGEQSIEFMETKMNKPLLQQIASKSGGKYSDASQFDSLIYKILSRPDMRPQERIHTRELELWNLPQYLSLIVLLFATEWFLRKRWGML